METPQAASAVVMYSKTTPVFIRGKEVYFEYSKSQIINTNATMVPSRAQKPTPHLPQQSVCHCTLLMPSPTELSSLFATTSDLRSLEERIAEQFTQIRVLLEQRWC